MTKTVPAMSPPVGPAARRGYAPSSHFTRFACFDWSGANTARPTGIALAIADEHGAPHLVERRWSRDDVLAWLREVASRREPMLIGLDLSPGLPFADAGAYFFDWSGSPPTATHLWKMVDRQSDGSAHLSATGFLRHPAAREHFLQPGHRGSAFFGNGRTRRCEDRLRETQGLSPSSCMKLIGPGQVGKSSLTGMRVLHRLRGAIPVWPFDPLPASGPLIVEVYPGIAAVAAGRPRGRTKMRSFEELDVALAHPAIGSPPTGLTGPATDHATDALLTAAWLRKAAVQPDLWSPSALSPAIARTEGWTFGVP